MSLDAMIWAVKVAPLANTEEHSVLTVLADEVDESGCGVLLATKTIADRALTSTKTAQRRIDDMIERGIIGLGDQDLALYIRADRRPVVYNLLIPYSAFAGVDRVNQARVAKGLPPLTPRPCPTPNGAGCGCPPKHGSPHRPDIAPAPARKQRIDAGKKKPRTDVDGVPVDDGTSSPPVAQNGVTSSPAANGVTTSPAGLQTGHGVTSSSPRGDYKPPDPVLDPVYDPPPAQAPFDAANAADPEEQEEEGPDEDSEDPGALAVVGQILDQVYTRTGVPSGRRRIGGWQAQQLVTALTKRLKDGWEPRALVDALSSDPLGPDVRSLFAVLSRRIAGLDGPPPPPGSKVALVPRPAWCGLCNEQTRLATPDVFDIDGHYEPGMPLQPCPICSPETQEAVVSA